MTLILSISLAPYVKVYLVSGKRCLAKAKTATARRTLDPLYQQQLSFSVPYTGCVLQVTSIYKSIHSNIKFIEFKLKVPINLIDFNLLTLINQYDNLLSKRIINTIHRKRNDDYN